MSEFLAGIDYGTGGAKSCVINSEGDVLGFAFEEYPFIHEKAGWSEHDPERYWEAACRLLKSWLLARLIALLAYIGFGVLTLRAGSTGLRAIGFVGALASIGYIFAVAFTRNPLPF